MKIKLCFAILVLTLFGAASANALSCMWCDTTMSCTQSCRDPYTWQPSTCGNWGVCSQYPACDSPCSSPGQTGTCSYNGTPTSCACAVDGPQVWICPQ